MLVIQIFSKVVVSNFSDGAFSVAGCVVCE